jgi:hypothetical protein
MAVEVGEVEVVAGPPEQNGAGRPETPAAPAGPPTPTEIERLLALQYARDLRLRAD